MIEHCNCSRGGEVAVVGGKVMAGECSSGVYDCQYENTPDCAEYNGRFIDMEGRSWIVVVTAAVMCIMAFGVGANDAANSWGTSVGSRAISLEYALYIAGFFELLGAVTLGRGVSEKLQDGVSEITDRDCWACGYCNSQISVYDLGMLGSLISGAIFLLIATATSLPVSTTHAIVGAIVGMTISNLGGSCVNWSFSGVGGIFASWIISPVISGLLASSNPTARIVTALPWIFSLVSFVMFILILTKSPSVQSVGVGILIVISFAAGALVWILVSVIVMPRIKDTFPSKKTHESDHNMTELAGVSDTNKLAQHGSPSDDPTHAASYTSYDWNIADAKYCFRYLLLFNAALLSFAHGANDTANSTAPFSAVYSVYMEGRKSCEDIGSQPEWVLFLAGVFVALGIVLYGRNVVVTIGEKLSDVDFCIGFCVQFASCMSVLIASYAGFPVSTTHCQVGAIIAVGYSTGGKENVRWDGVIPILGAWIITVPFAGLLSAALLALFKLGLT